MHNHSVNYASKASLCSVHILHEDDTKTSMLNVQREYLLTIRQSSNMRRLHCRKLLGNNAKGITNFKNNKNWFLLFFFLSSSYFFLNVLH